MKCRWLSCALLALLTARLATALPQDLPDWVGELNLLGAGLGYAVASVGDVDGDGYDDVVIGAPWYTRGTTTTVS